MQKFPTEDDPLTIQCEFCDNGYYDNGGNDVKCDHCQGSGEIQGSLTLTSSGTMLHIKHTHFVQILGKKISYEEDKEAYFRYIECPCGLTGVNECGKIIWNESNYCERLGRTIRK